MNLLNKTKMGSKGFTLIELIAVLIVIGIISAIAASRMTSSGTELYTELDTLKSNLRFAQIKALTNNDDTTTTWGISFTGTSYTLNRNGANASIKFPADGSNTHNLSSGVTITSPAAVTYNFWGSPGADITVTLNEGSSSVSFTIVNNTGFIQ